MDIKEAVAQKVEAERAIMEILKKFEAETGLLVNAVALSHFGLVKGFGEPPIGAVKIDIRL